MKFKDFYIGQKVISKGNRAIPFYRVTELGTRYNTVTVAIDDCVYVMKKSELKLFVPFNTPIKYTKAQLESFTKEELINILLKKGGGK